MASLRFENPKDARDTAPYTFDWSEHLGGRLDGSGQPEALTINPGPQITIHRIGGGEADLTSQTVQVQGHRVIVILSGGTVGQSYGVECEITLSNGEVYNREAVLKVRDL